MIKPWVFEFVETHEDADPVEFNAARAAEILAWKGELWPRLETMGFEGLFFSEHHFRPNCLSPSPNLFVAWVGARTRTLRLGVMGQVTPLHHPWRVAEESALLDQLTGGRLEFGFSSGIPTETALTGVPKEELRPRFEEALALINAALTQPTFSHKGRFWTFDDMRIIPWPLQSNPPKWITVLSASGADYAARHGYKICTGFLPTEGVAALFAQYRDIAHKAGQDATPDQLGLRRIVFIADTDAEAERIGHDAAARMEGRLKRSFGRLEEIAAPDAPAHSQSFFTGPDEMIAGSPETVAAKIIDQCQRTGAGHFLGYTIDTLTKAQVDRSYELWPQVLPRLRGAEMAG